MFKNGKARILRLIIFELFCGVMIMAISQTLGNLPSQDWLTPQQIKKVAFLLAMLQTLLKACEMLFSKTVSLFQEYDQKTEQQLAETLTPKPPIMKKLLSILTLSAALTCASQADTNSPSLGLGPQLDTVASFLSEGSNWIVAPYGIAYNSSGKTRFGGGIGIGYHVSDFVVPTMRLDLLDRQFYMPSGSLQLQLPVTVGKFTVVPLAFSGIATPLGGRQGGNGAVVGIFGAGAAVRIGKRWDLIGDMEKWTSFTGNQYRFGFAYRF